VRLNRQRGAFHLFLAPPRFLYYILAYSSFFSPLFAFFSLRFSVTNPPLDFPNLGKLNITPDDVQLVVAESGLSLAGKELIVWKRNIVIAAGRRRAFLAPAPDVNAAFFDTLLARCPRAVGIRLDGSLVLPRLNPESAEDPLQVLGNAFQAAKRELGRQVLKSAGATLVTLLIAALRLYFGIHSQIAHPNKGSGANTAMWGIIFVVATALLAIRTIALYIRRHRIVSVLNDILRTGDLNPERLARAVAPTSSRAILAATGAPAPPPEVSTAALFLAILSLCVMCFPFLGLFFSLFAFFVTLRKKHWTRTAGITALIVSILATSYIVIILLLSKK
jgi:hypothetical protein